MQCSSLTPCENSEPYEEDIVQIYLVSTDLSEAKLPPKTAKPEEVFLVNKSITKAVLKFHYKDLTF